MPTKPSRRSITPNGPEIKKLRLEKSHSVKALAGAAGIGERTLQRAEKGTAILPHFIPLIATSWAFRQKLSSSIATTKKATTKKPLSACCL